MSALESKDGREAVLDRHLYCLLMLVIQDASASDILLQECWYRMPQKLQLLHVQQLHGVDACKQCALYIVCMAHDI